MVPLYQGFSQWHHLVMVAHLQSRFPVNLDRQRAGDGAIMFGFPVRWRLDDDRIKAWFTTGYCQSV